MLIRKELVTSSHLPCNIFAKTPSLHFPVTADYPFLVTISQTTDKSMHNSTATKCKYSLIAKLTWQYVMTNCQHIYIQMNNPLSIRHLLNNLFSEQDNQLNEPT